MDDYISRKWKPNSVEVAILKSDKTDFKSKPTVKETDFIMIQGLIIHQEDINEKSTLRMGENICK